jgi:hypothetical protein
MEDLVYWVRTGFFRNPLYPFHIGEGTGKMNMKRRKYMRQDCLASSRCQINRFDSAGDAPDRCRIDPKNISGYPR